ncbi:hypothetical protein PR048_006822 [Dryococelus australis]|uniref:Acyl-CoA Delta(11) desaturase n=1 Tax=Dryococelus australis TaxID=614101 RepID=A0ABQ9IC05_9NEOP|nr:hypothetical protein PR048_006822 [Dryococelus australis]
MYTCFWYRLIYAAENMSVAFMTMGEGWHNYHHTFPWDYRAAELGSYAFNMTTFYLNLFAKIGWAYDLKCPSKDLVKRVAERYGDGSYPHFGGHLQEVEEEDDPNMKIMYPLTENNAD